MDQRTPVKIATKPGNGTWGNLNNFVVLLSEKKYSYKWLKIEWREFLSINIGECSINFDPCWQLYSYLMHVFIAFNLKRLWRKCVSV
jgi:hypothetical protein